MDQQTVWDRRFQIEAAAIQAAAVIVAAKKALGSKSPMLADSVMVAGLAHEIVDQYFKYKKDASNQSANSAAG